MGLAYRTKSILAGINKPLRNKYLRDAESSYTEAVDILKSYNSNYNLALVHQLLKNYNQAGYYYCRAIELEPMQYEAHFNLAIVLNELKDYINANKEFEKASLILSSKGDSEKSRYIFYMLMDVGQKIALFKNDDEYKRKLEEEKEKYTKKSIYKAGKLVLDDNDEKGLREDFKRCEGSENFAGGI